MGVISRIKRPTYATPRKAPTGRMVHVSTDYKWVPIDPLNPTGPARFVKVFPGKTYRRPA